MGAQRSSITYPRSHSLYVTELGENSHLTVKLELFHLTHFSSQPTERMEAPAPHGLPAGGDSTTSATSQDTNNSPDMKVRKGS